MTRAGQRPAAGLCVVLALLGVLIEVQAAGQHGRGLVGPAAEGLEQILDDGQPEDIGYGFQRARTVSRNSRNARPDVPSLLLLDASDLGPQHHTLAADLDDEPIASSAFRERMASRQRRQRQQQQQQQQRQQQQWGDWRHDNPSVSSFYPAGTSEPGNNQERYLQALREAWARYQQQTGTIDVGPDDLTDLETLQFLEALGEDIPGTRKRASNPGRQFAQGAASPYDWVAPLAWSGYTLRKRSASPDYQDDSGEWSDEAAASDNGEDAPLSPGAGGNRLAMLLTQQLFDERYNDPAVKRLLLSKRSLPQHQHAQKTKSADEKVDAALPGIQGRAMRRRKKSTRPALDIQVAQPAKVHDAKQDLMAIFGENEPDGELEPPLALPLAGNPPEVAAESENSPTPTAAATDAAAAATTAAAPAQNNTSTPGVVPMNPIGHAHETDKIAREHALHPSPTGTGAPDKTNVNVHVHTAEHAPPMVSAEGPHGHDQAVHADEKPTQAPTKDGAPPGGAGGAGRMGVSESEAPRRLSKKSIDWSQYFGLDRRRKKSLSLNDIEANDAPQVDADWLMRHNLMAFSKLSKPSNINKRVAIKREGASPDALLLGSWGARQAWDGGQDDDDEEVGQSSVVGHCPAVSRLAESCRGAVGSNDALVPLCVLYQACHLCGAAMSVQVGSSCEAELGRRGADMCASTTSPAREAECRGGVEAIVQLYRSRFVADTETCVKQPCLAHFFLTAPAVAFAR